MQACAVVPEYVVVLEYAVVLEYVAVQVYVVVLVSCTQTKVRFERETIVSG